MKKETVDNPRYPHDVLITRLLMPDNPFYEEDNEETEEENAEEDVFGDTEEETVETDTETSSTDEQSDEESVEEEPDVRYEFPDETEEITHDVTIVLYEGKGRAFTDTTTTGDAKMDENRRKCSIPVRFDKWTHEILDGDTIAVKVGNIIYSGVVKDIEPDNDRTIVYWERPRVNN